LFLLLLRDVYCFCFFFLQVRVPAAVSVVWMALVGSSMAVAFRFMPVKDE